MTGGRGRDRGSGDDTGRRELFREPDYVGRYEDDRYGGAFGRWLRRRETEHFRELVGQGRHDLLDAGGGTGKLALTMAASARSTTVCDFSLPMLRRCREEAREAGIGLALAAAGLEALPFRDRAFDVVVCSRVLMHLEDWRRGLGELCRVTRRHLVVDFPPTRSVAGVDSLVKRVTGGGRDPARTPYWTFRVGDVRNELEGRGFEVARADRGFVLPHLLHRGIDRPSVSRGIEALLGRLGLADALGSPVTVKASRRDGDDGGRMAAVAGHGGGAR